MNSEFVELLQELIDLSKASNIGFNCSKDEKMQIETLAQQIEANNPTPEPTSHMELAQGRSKLLYSTFGLEQQTSIQRLSFGTLPDVKVNVTAIFQEIQQLDQQYINLIEFTLDSGIQGIVKIAARYTVNNSSRLTIDFLEASVKAATTDLNEKEFCKALAVDDVSVLKSTLSGSGWSDITYLDGNLRLNRGNQQNLYVLVHE
jgi:PAP_fibrillin